MEVEFKHEIAEDILVHVQELCDDPHSAVFHMMCVLVALVNDRTSCISIMSATYDIAEQFKKARESGAQNSDGDTVH